ncbi:hypothetical protein AB8O64_03585 [Streptomyces sp. QH1-20]|uniref:hypothetical protein n=1 Tax=Streptomyces sp. QH1-20 TaxID=3240934 RepID=UPI003518F996
MINTMVDGFKKIGVLAGAAGLLAVSLVGMSAGTAAAASCKTAAPVQTTGNIVNDTVAQANGAVSAVTEIVTCSAGTANGAVNGPEASADS